MGEERPQQPQEPAEGTEEAEEAPGVEWAADNEGMPADNEQRSVEHPQEPAEGLKRLSKPRVPSELKATASSSSSRAGRASFVLSLGKWNLESTNPYIGGGRSARRRRTTYWSQRQYLQPL